MFNERINAKTTVEILTGSDPVIYVDINAIGKMKEYVDGCNDEIGWLGEVVKNDLDDYVIKDVHLFKQQVHSTTCEITTEGLTEFANEVLTKPNGIDMWNDMKLWGHSHVNMGVTPSAQDNSQMEIFKDCGHDFFIRVIANKKGEMEFTLYNFITGLIYKNVKWTTLYNNREIYSIQERINELQATLSVLKQPSIDKVGIKTEIANKVSKISYGGVKVYGTGVSGYNNYGSYGSWWDENYNKNELVDVGKKKTQQMEISPNPNQKEVNEISGGVSNTGVTVEDEILMMYIDNDFVALENFFTVDEIFEISYMSLISIKQEAYDNFAEYIGESTCEKLKELCTEYTRVYSQQYGL